MIEKLKSAFSSIANHRNSIQTEYAKVNREYLALGEELSALAAIPPSRKDLLAWLTTAVERYLAVFDARLLEQIKVIATSGDEYADERAVILGQTWHTHGPENGFPALLRESLLQGAREFAARCEWPEGMDTAERQRQADLVKAKMASLAAVLDAMRAEAAKNGVILEA